MNEARNTCTTFSTTIKLRITGSRTILLASPGDHQSDRAVLSLWQAFWSLLGMVTSAGHSLTEPSSWHDLVNSVSYHGTEGKGYQARDVHTFTVKKITLGPGMLGLWGRAAEQHGAFLTSKWQLQCYGQLRHRSYKFQFLHDKGPKLWWSYNRHGQQLFSHSICFQVPGKGNLLSFSHGIINKKTFYYS